MTVFAGHDLACVRADRLVFAGLSFALEAGGALKLLGPNGSGKSSLLRLMTGLLPPARGHMEWGDRNVTDDSLAHRHRLHYVGHADAIKPALTVSENLAFWSSLKSAGGGADDASQAALGQFGLEDFGDIPARFLSAGQRRRLSLSRLLASPAELWLLDEPTVGLDSAAVAAFESAVAAHRKQGGRVVLATHTEIRLPRARTIYLDDYGTELSAELSLDEDTS